MDLPPEGIMTRQNAYTDYLWSQAYADLGLIDAAAAPAQDALVSHEADQVTCPYDADRRITRTIEPA